ncbi:ABC transporter ATP-binding protein [Actinomycetaceae bacterium L2_0104]
MPSQDSRGDAVHPSQQHEVPLASSAATTPSHISNPSPVEAEPSPGEHLAALNLGAMTRDQEASVRRNQSQERTPRPVRIGPTPERWPAFLREPEGEPADIPTDPNRLMRHIFRSNWKTLLLCIAMTSLFFVSMAMLPWAVGELLDSGIENGLSTRVIPWMLVSLGLIVLAGAASLNEPAAIGLWLHGTWDPIRRLLRNLFPRRSDVSQKMASGDIVAAVTTDGDKLGAVLAFMPDAIGSAIAFVVVAVLMLQVSVPLGLFVLIGMPLLLFGISRIIKPLQEKIAAQREEQGRLTSLASDAVVGLRVLRGVGGEDVYNEKYIAQSETVQSAGIRAAKPRALLNAIQTAGPALFTAIVVGGGLYLTYQGIMTPGQLFAFYGYTVFLGMPIGAISQTIQMGTRAWVGAKKISRVMKAKPIVDDAAVDPARPELDWSRVSLTDGATGLRIDPGKITALVAASPLETSGIAARLTRVDDADTTYADGVDLRSYPLDEVREHILLSGAVAELFTGTLRSGLLGSDAPEIAPRTVYEQMADVQSPGGENRALFDEGAQADSSQDDALIDALATADAHDVLTSVDGGLAGQIAERGRSLSGGQRQRVALARALVQQPDIAVFIEPTSAVDSHTESRIARRLAEARRQKTTVLVTASPLVLDKSDEVILVAHGREVARGNHRDLLKNPHYYDVVHRGVESPVRDDAGTSDDAGASDDAEDHDVEIHEGGEAK